MKNIKYKDTYCNKLITFCPFSDYKDSKYYVSNEGDNFSTIFCKLIELAAKKCDSYSSDIYYDMKAFEQAVEDREEFDSIFIFRECGVTSFSLLESNAYYMNAEQIKEHQNCHFWRLTRKYDDNIKTFVNTLERVYPFIKELPPEEEKKDDFDINDYVNSSGDFKTVFGIETDSDGERWVHFYGYCYYVGDDAPDVPYRSVEYTFFYLPLKDVVKNGLRLSETIEGEKVNTYIGDITYDEVINFYKNFIGEAYGSAHAPAQVERISEDLEDGIYVADYE